MFRKLLGPLLAVGLIAGVSAGSSQTVERVDETLNARIREEGTLRSDLQRLVHMLTDVHGPRITGGPNLESAGRWAVQTMSSWGLQNGRMEPWDWGHEGWQNERAAGHIVAPVKDRLEFEVYAWTPSTNGTVTAEAVHFLPPEGPLSEVQGRGRGPARLGPTEAELTAYFESMAARVRDRIVLVGRWSAVPVDFTPAPLRENDDQMRARYRPPDPNAPPAPGRGTRGNAAGGRGRGASTPADGRLTAQQVATRIGDFLRANRPALRIYDAARPHGQVDASSVTGYNASQTIPTILMRNEDYGRITRILGDGTPVTLEFEIVNRTYPQGRTAYNAIAEIPGTDKADEVVMLGGHLDSWHSATGATDNAVGCAVMMEAVRILKALGVRPRRTIRVALWSGEEQGLLGSRAYVAEHFGSAEQPKPAFSKLSAYWNVDGGTGRLRGASVFGPPAAATVLTALFRPFEDFGIHGASATRSRGGGGTDSGSFNGAGLPGIDTAQDPIEYETHTHHTSLDTYERIVWDDATKAAIVTASIVYHLAMRNELLPRFAAESMPPAPQGRGRGAGQ